MLFFFVLTRHGPRCFSYNRIFDKFTLHSVYCCLLGENIVRSKQRKLSLMTFHFKGDFPL